MPRQETSLERIERILYEHGEANAKKPKHYNNSNIIAYENWQQEPKKFDNNDPSSFPSDRDQQQRLNQRPKHTYMNNNEIILSEYQPSDLKGAAPDLKKMVRSAKAKKYRLLNQAKVLEPSAKISEPPIFKNNINKKSIVPAAPIKRSSYASGGSVAAYDDPDYGIYLKEIEIGNLDPSISFDRWKNEKEDFELGLPYTKRKERNVLDELNLSNALAKISNAMSGISGVVARRKLAGGGSSNKPKEPSGVRRINLADYFRVGMTVADLTDEERETIKWLLKKSLSPNKDN